MASLWNPPVASFSPVRPTLNPSKMASNFNHTLRRRGNDAGIGDGKGVSSSLSMAAGWSSDGGDKSTRKLPVLLFDIMGTIVRDPFYEDVPAFFRMPMEELLELKHPTVWLEFEKGLIDEAELEKKFFKDGRAVDFEGLKNCMISGYSYLEGIEELLNALKEKNYEMHAFTNYPIWFVRRIFACHFLRLNVSLTSVISFGRYEMIEEKLKISRYLSWTFCSCKNGKRKPDPDFYLEALRHLEVEPASCIFIDDRKKNVEAAKEVGIVGLHFRSADLLLQDLCRLGLDISPDIHHLNSAAST
ncbi:LOW QUALITY PROTEIN: flavin mononucleotide hydrolase 1, chloroplatic [Cucurbita moschata]|uniref:LOW QUALITY PROTEIN: flavin mononucleotide hydrolase 1, chloroplatic n=1 Tax=Cucurbita moschata TaxID=3662 RepID=A0A6J1FBS7_CUCMO|nr:LOW QUALITY PROTEIN: flavin mononucleotide hydrolase 1, chloroplatic [Cucurbita moschata]